MCASLCLAVLLPMVTGGVAFADRQKVRDEDDSPGALDIRSVAHKHGERRLLVHNLSTYEEWSSSTLEVGSQISWYFRYGGKLRRTGITRAAEDGTLYTEILKGSTNRILGFAKTWRPDAESVRIELPRRLLGRGVSQYRWYVTTVFHQDDHPDCGLDGSAVVECFDRAPDRGWILHDISS